MGSAIVVAFRSPGCKTTILGNRAVARPLVGRRIPAFVTNPPTHKGSGYRVVRGGSHDELASRSLFGIVHGFRLCRRLGAR